MERFKKIYHQGTIDVIEIWVDTQTGLPAKSRPRIPGC